MRGRKIRNNGAKPPRRARTGRSGEAGYAYAFALFATLALIVTSQVVLQNLATESRREREAEMIWRGRQWARAVRLYFHKTGHYPQSVDDLEKGVPDLHFLRPEAYKDPMNGDDGSWRFIYVNGSGQIIGSVRYATLQQMALIDLGAGNQIPGVQLPGTPVSSMASTFGSSASSNAFSSGFSSIFNNSGSSSNGPGSGSSNGAGGGSNSTTATGGSSTDNSSSQGTQGGSSSSSSSAQQGSSTGMTDSSSSSSGSQSSLFSSDQSTQPQNPLLALQPTGPVDGPVIGAFITGVGSKVDKPSLKIYHGGKKYKDWEFIWNPLEEQAQAMQQGLTNIQTGQGIAASGISGSAMGTSSAGQGGMSEPQSAPSNPSTSSQ